MDLDGIVRERPVPMPLGIGRSRLLAILPATRDTVLRQGLWNAARQYHGGTDEQANQHPNHGTRRAHVSSPVKSRRGHEDGSFTMDPSAARFQRRDVQGVLMSIASPIAEVLIVTADPEVAKVADQLADDRIRTHLAETGPDALRILLETPNCLVVLDSELEAEAAFKLYRILHDAEPRPVLMLLTAARFSQFAFDSRRPVLDDYALKPLGLDELVLRIKAALLRTGFTLPEPTPGEAAPAVDRGGLRKGEIITVFSTKGGVGKTTVAVNLAVGLAKQRQRKTLLVDADLWFGDASVMLNLAPDRGIRNVCEAEELDYTVLQRALTVHESGLALLARPKDPSIVDQLDPGAIVRAIQGYATLFDYVIVDMRASFDELNLQLLDAADRILLVTTPEVSASHTTASFIQMSESLGYTDKLHLVLNRANSGLALEALENIFGLPMAVSLPSAGKLVVGAANQGVPLMMHESSANEEITRAFMRVVNLVSGDRATPQARTTERQPSRDEGRKRGMRGLFGSLSLALGGAQ
ncbi:MAG: pilus assembly protein CpaE [Chloroflexota bacterium]|nr:pilus assembly protein CpaE [Chloroflexota bacterium]